VKLIRRVSRRGLNLWGLGLAASAFTLSANAADESFTDLSLTELMNEPVTTVSKKATRLGDAATAITVITPDDIRRNGFTSIPEALRLVPGFDVARIDSSHWAISARGFNLQYSNLLLVLVDGRSVYTPAFGGVYWDAQDVSLEDLDRIEVIRGPGATLWGANAVNGVVNIITKNSRETHGAVISAVAGTEDQPLLEARYGSSLGEGAHYRVYAKYFDRDGLYGPDGREAFDDWHSVRVGFRSDWDRTESDLVTVQGDYYSLRAEHLQNELAYSPPFVRSTLQVRESEGANLLGRWTHTLSDVSHISVQAYLDTYDMALESRHTADLQFEQRFALGARNDVVWGASYRVSEDELHLGADTVTRPSKDTLNFYTAFVQDEISLMPDLLRATVGAKLEHNEFTGLEVQPNLRLLLTPNARTTFWAAASRAVSTPSRFFHDARYNISAFQPPASPVTVVALMPVPSLPSEKLDAYELGFRFEPSKSISLDIATFINRYRDIYGESIGTPFFELEPVPHVLVPVSWEPFLKGRAHGVETSVSWRVTDVWQVNASYTWLHLRLTPDNTYGIGSPEQQASVRSRLSLSRSLELNAGVYYVDPIDSLTPATEVRPIPSYMRVDTGLLYHASATLELGLWGQNLFDHFHQEMISQDAGTVSRIPRSVLFRISKRF
jgi:iron complex outermembrane receptor protein